MKKLKEILSSTVGRIVSSVLIICFVLSWFFCFDMYKREFNKVKAYYYIYKGDKAYKEHNLQEAVNYYEYGIKLHPRHYKAMYNLANIYVAYEDYYSALKNYEKALEIKPDYDVARIDYAIILSETYRVDKAIEEYKKVIDTKPKFIKIPFLVDNKKSYNHNRGVAYYNMGLTYRTKSLLAGLNDYARYNYLNKASTSYKNAVDILNSYNSNYNLGLIHQLLKNKNQAGFYYCKAIALSPMEYEAHFNLAVLLNDLEEYQGAQEEFQKAGLILDSKGEGVKTAYIYNVLDEVNKKIATLTPNAVKKKIKEKEEEVKTQSKYKAGKLVIDSLSEDDLKAYFSVCARKELFLGDM